MNNELRVLVDIRDRVLQKARIAFNNRLAAIENGADETSAENKALIEQWLKRFDDLEKQADEDIRELSKDFPIIDEMEAVKGVGRLLAAKVVSMIDIERSETVSALWRYAGYAVIDGARERPTKGEKLHYNNRLKTTCYLVGTSFLRSGSPYRRVYDSAREYYEAMRPDWTDGHRHNAAMRKMIKMWLSHLWLRWRTLEGLPVSDPYVHDKLGHAHNYAPEEFGWPELAVSNENPA